MPFEFSHAKPTFKLDTAPPMCPFRTSKAYLWGLIRDRLHCLQRDSATPLSILDAACHALITRPMFPPDSTYHGLDISASRLKIALERIDTVVHAAALKQVPAAEYNPMEFVKTNVLGAENLIQACLDTGVKRVVALSTDKAAAPINLYGATKLCSDKLFIAANNIIGYRDLKFSVVRYGNVMGSRGSVIPYFLKQRESGKLTITDESMTRFNISLQEGVEMVLWTLENSSGGEIFVPKIPSYRITDVAEAIGPSCDKVNIGIRPGEKIHEEMITSSDSASTVDLGSYFAILPSDGTVHKLYDDKGVKYRRVEEGFKYNSGDNSEFLSIERIRELIRKNIDKDFVPC